METNFPRIFSYSLHLVSARETFQNCVEWAVQFSYFDVLPLVIVLVVIILSSWKFGPTSRSPDQKRLRLITLIKASVSLPESEQTNVTGVK